MELVVFSSKETSLTEIKDVIELFKHGLETFHLRKPKFGKTQTEDYLNAIPKEYHNRIVVHNYHSLRNKFDIKGLHLTREHRKSKYNSKFKLFKFKVTTKGYTLSRSVSKIESLELNLKKYSYIFLTPVFNSISQNGHSGNFGERSITKYVQQCSTKVYALGGVQLDNIEYCHKVGFDGVVLLGTIWHSGNNPLESFLKIQKKISDLTT